MASVPEQPRRQRRRVHPAGGNGEFALGPDAFREGFGEELRALLDLGTWRAGRNLDEEYAEIEEQIRQAIADEEECEAVIREQVHALLAEDENAPPGAGRHAVTVDEIRAAHQGLLFNGVVEACDGTSHVHHRLALCIHQVGVSLVSYGGDCQCWHTRLFRRDLRERHHDPIQAVLGLLERRGRRGGRHEDDRDVLSELARRGLMSWAERAVLARCSQAAWRMGHGSPAPLELICNYFTDLVIESIRVIRELIEHRRFVFVASEPRDQALLTIGQSLRPLEYAIIGTLRDRIWEHLEEWRPTQPASVDLHWDGEELDPVGWVTRFRDEVATQVVYGVYRATPWAPPQVFYAHVEHAHVAARIALADSVLQEQRGFPLLIDLADRVCRSVYGGGTLEEMAEAAYAAAGAPFRYGSERDTRER
jgi:hypothetical protein